MKDQYRQTAAASPRTVEERETPRNLHDFGKYVLSPSVHSYFYGFSMGAGVALSLAALKDFNMVVLFFGLAFAFGGSLGMLMLREQIAEYNKPAMSWHRKETSSEPDDDRDYVRFNRGTKETSYIPKRRKNVALDTGTGATFVFIGTNIDRLYQWIKEYDTSLRKVGTDNLPGFNQLPEPIQSEAYTAARKALIHNGLISDRGNGATWTNEGIIWLETAGVK